MAEDTKLCPRCDQIKPWSEFYIDRKRARPGTYCKLCAGEYKKARYVPRTPVHAAVCGQCGGPMPSGRSSRPRRFCGRKCLSDWHNAQQTREFRRDSWLRAKYGITLEAYGALLADQGGVCRLCGTPEKDARHGVLDVDHDHETGQIRGLLCHRCNWALGIMRDDLTWLRAAVAYLERESIDGQLGDRERW